MRNIGGNSIDVSEEQSLCQRCITNHKSNETSSLRKPPQGAVDLPLPTWQKLSRQLFSAKVRDNHPDRPAKMLRNFILLQIRDHDDDIRHHELDCFARAAKLPIDAIRIVDLLATPLDSTVLGGVDCVIVGGSGKYSAAAGGPWLDQALESLRFLHASKIPTFASCWGHQAIARAMGGTVLNAPDQAEVGTIRVDLTEAGQQDVIYKDVGDSFAAQAGHEDSVTQLPPNTTLLASSSRCNVHSFRFDDAPIYCTQFHPELEREDLLSRLRAYPEYVQNIAGVPLDEFEGQASESPEASQLIAKFVSAFVSVAPS